MEAKRIAHAVLAVVMALTGAAVAAAQDAAPAAPASGPTTAAPAAGGTVVKGYIERAKLDDEGNTAEIGVWDETAQEFFIIAPGGPGTELKAHVGERMEATGTVREEDGQKILTVGTFTLVKEERPVEPDDLGESGETEEPADDSAVTTDEEPGEGEGDEGEGEGEGEGDGEGDGEGEGEGDGEGGEGEGEGEGGATEPGPGDEGEGN